MDSTFFSSLPKIEIHNHLEGTITPRTLQKLAKKHVSESTLARSLQECQKLYEFTSFTGFLNTFSKVNSFIQEVSDLDNIIQNSFENLQRENYRYIEYFISIDTFLKKGMSLSEILDRLKAITKRYSTKNIRIGGFIIDFVRNYGPDNAIQILNDLKPILDDYRDILLGVSIGGDEINFPAPAFWL